MTNFQLLILSLVQGTTEFVPVSSSAHLIAISKLLQWADQGLIIDVALHFGTLGAVLIYFSKEVFRGFVGLKDIVRFDKTPNSQFILNVIIATIPIVVIGFLYKTYVFGEFRTDKIIELIGWMSIVFGVLLWLIDNATPTITKIEHMTKINALFLGLAQTLALVPGVSRSGICMTAARLIGMERVESAKFSMIMGIPTLGAASSLIGVDLYLSKDSLLTNQSMLGAFAAFIIGLISIKIILHWLKTSTMLPFVIYRIIFGILLLNLDFVLELGLF